MGAAQPSLARTLPAVSSQLPGAANSVRGAGLPWNYSLAALCCRRWNSHSTPLLLPKLLHYPLAFGSSSRSNSTSTSTSTSRAASSKRSLGRSSNCQRWASLFVGPGEQRQQPCPLRLPTPGVLSPSGASPHVRRAALGAALSRELLGAAGTGSARLGPRMSRPMAQGAAGAEADEGTEVSRIPTETATGAGRRIDSHLHVWASQDESSLFPYFPGQEPSLPGDSATLLKEMEAAGVQGALIIQPINHKFDHSYVTKVIRAHPGRFVGCCLANPAADGSGVSELRRLLQHEPYRAVRFNPYLWPAGEKMSNRVGQELFRVAGEFRAPVGFMCFKGLMLHIEDIEELCAAHPGTPVIMDHLGFCRSPYDAQHSSEADKAAWHRLLGLARFPQVHVKCSAFFRISRKPYPYEDTWPMVKDLVHAFGAQRVMYGSDFPFVVAECGYDKAWDILPKGFLSEDQMQWIASETVQSLFPGSWGKPW